MLATLIRLLGDFDLAEEALHDAFAAALEQWPREACRRTRAPGSSRPAASRRSTRLRRRARFDASRDDDRATRLELRDAPRSPTSTTSRVEDDRLRLIFTCCHPALRADAQVALTLREVCGLTTEEIARAFLTPPPTLAQRIVRAKAKIRDARHPVRRCPTRAELPERLDAVLHVIYLVFNEGYAASSGDVADAARPVGARRSGWARLLRRAAARSRRRWACSR